MPPGRRGRRAASDAYSLAGSGLGRGANTGGPSILGKRRGGPDDELIN